MLFEVANCDLKASCSCRVSWKAKSAGNLLEFRLTAS